MVRRQEDLFRPRGGVSVGIHYDPDAFGRFSESIARFFGTARFLVVQTILVIGWIALNTFALIHHWDPYPFILLNLAFSTQAAYAAPLILLAQNRQAERDREQNERDRAITARAVADAEYLARELASIRLALADVVTNEDLADALKDAFERVAAAAEPVHSDATRSSSDGTTTGGDADADHRPSE